MALPCLKNARRIFAIVSTTSIPTSASKNHGSQCGPSVPGSRLEADHPEKGVLFACRFTPDGESIVEHVAGVEDYQVALATFRAACERWPGTPSPCGKALASSRIAGATGVEPREDERLRRSSVPCCASSAPAAWTVLPLE